MYVVGLTGGIGSGKSTVAAMFAARGVTVVDSDAIAHELTGPGGAAMAELQRMFGTEILRPDGGLNRAAMRTHVFADPAARARLEGVLHPLIRHESDRRVSLAASPYAILEVPLLLETAGFRERCDRILVVDCAESIQVARVQTRNCLDEVEVRAIMAAQTSRAARISAADDVISNDGSPAELEVQVEQLHLAYLRAALMKVKANC